MYFKSLETDREAKQAHDTNLKINASERLKANAEYKKKQKRSS